MNDFWCFDFEERRRVMERDITSVRKDYDEAEAGFISVHVAQGFTPESMPWNMGFDVQQPQSLVLGSRGRIDFSSCRTRITNVAC
jgi:hypothetical protein